MSRTVLAFSVHILLLIMMLNGRCVWPTRLVRHLCIHIEARFGGNDTSTACALLHAERPCVIFYFRELCMVLMCRYVAYVHLC